MELTQQSRESQMETGVTTTRSEGLRNPAVPAYILRGHISAIHALHFFASNAYLSSADSDGWLVVWSLASKRAVAVWKAHDGGILGIRNWGHERLITHGRDHKLRVWQLRKTDFENLDVKLPVEGADGADQKNPWLLHALDVNALNFCAFAMCYDRSATGEAPKDEIDEWKERLDEEIREEGAKMPLLLAAPNALDSGGIDIFQLPSGRRVSKISSDKSTTTGMVMTLEISFHPICGELMVMSGYEDGQTLVHVQRSPHSSPELWSWERILLSKPHSQPVLSLASGPEVKFYITSSADANIAKFLIPISPAAENWSSGPAKIVNTKHAGQQGLSMRSDGKIFATAGWDARVRVFSTKTMKELAVLKWHKEGCFATAFAHVSEPQVTTTPQPDTGQLRKRNALDVIKEQRSAKAQQTHWLAAGGKDSKISLWDIY